MKNTRNIGLLLLVILLPWVSSAGGTQTGQTLAPVYGQVTASPETDAGLPQGVQRANQNIQVLVELTDLPAVVVYAEAMKSAAGGQGQAKTAAVNAAKMQLALVQAQQNQVAANLTSTAIDATEIYRINKVLNGIAVIVKLDRLDKIRALKGVKAIRVLQPEHLDNSTSMPFLGVNKLWGNTAGVGYPVMGTGVRIGIIDTGIDYLHANFGGSAALTDYTSNNRTVAPDAFFPTAKVVGGWDFAGDNYNAVGNNGTTGSTTPTPDADPMDCNGHGSHVAGTAAGFGVNNDSTRYAGTYPPADFNAMRIGPGAAPDALLYALRVFGCQGSTNLSAAAIDWAVDPNGDTDFSDHLDVINMSLGSSFGFPSDTTTLAAENAALAGVIVVVSAGNAGDVFYVVGSPGVATRALTVAAAYDDGGNWLATINQTVPSATTYTANNAAFGTAPPVFSRSGDVVLVNDGVGTTSDGCEAPFVNAAAIIGRIALIDRGICGFALKAKNAQDAGAIGVIIANNSGGTTALAPGGWDGSITIPVLGTTQNNGNAIKTLLGSGTVTVTLQTVVSPVGVGDYLASFTSRGPRGGDQPILLKPDITAPGANISSTLTGTYWDGLSCASGCNAIFYPNSGYQIMSGTSMACPHMTGIMALMRQIHPDWSVEELKALVMNYSLQDIFSGFGHTGSRYSPSRIGNGEVNPSVSGPATVVALNADDSGAVSVTFPSEVAGTPTFTKTVRLVNHGAAAQTYNLAIDTVLDAPGVTFAVPASVTVGANSTTTFNVTMTTDASLMDHSRDSTLAATQNSNPRHWLTEEASFINFNVAGPSGTTILRLPVYAAPIPVSAMTAPATIAASATTIPLSGTDVCTGTAGPGTCAVTYTSPTFDVVSRVTPFELQVVSPREPILPAYMDLQYAGVAYVGGATPEFLFGVSTWGNWNAPSDVEFDIYLDTDNDATDEYVLYNSRRSASSASPADGFYGRLLNLTTFAGVWEDAINVTTPNLADSRAMINSVMFLPVRVADLALAVGVTSIRYRIEVYGRSNNFDNAPGPYFWDYNAQGMNFAGSMLLPDLNTATIPVTINTTNMTTNGSLGALLLHHHNAAGTQAQIVLLNTEAQTDIGVTYSASTTTPAFNSNVVLTLTATNNGPTAATGVVLAAGMPPGLTFVSADSVAYSSGTALWTVGSLAVSASATLHITAQVQSSQAITALAQVSSSTPLDTNNANNQASVVINAAAAADLSLAKRISVPPTPPYFGSTITYVVTLSNAGPDSAFNVVVNDLLPVGLSYVSSTTTGGTYDPVSGQWTLLSVGNAISETLTIVARIDGSGNFVNIAAIASSSAFDPDTTNNSASAAYAVDSIPLLSPWGIGLLAMILLFAGLFALRRIAS